MNSEAPIKSPSSAILNNVVSIAECFKCSSVIDGAQVLRSYNEQQTKYRCDKKKNPLAPHARNFSLVQIFRVVPGPDAVK